MNLPTKITMLRIILLPLTIFFYLATFVPFGKLYALILFIICILTDFFDGYLARKLNMTTTLGAFLDAIADKIVNLSMLALVLCLGSTNQIIGVLSFIIILCRELTISALRQLAASKNVIIKADMLGKIKTTIQFLTISLFILFAFLIESFTLTATFRSVLEAICYTMLGLSVAITILSGVNYLVQNRHVFKN